MQTKSETIRARVTPSLKKNAEAIFAMLGLSATDAITMFYKQVVLNEGIPFEMKVPNRETRKAMEEVKAGKVIKSNLAELRRKFK